jgi:hypothetical protein
MRECEAGIDKNEERLAAGVVDWSPFPRAALVAGVCLVTSTLLWLLLRSRVTD